MVNQLITFTAQYLYFLSILITVFFYLRSNNKVKKHLFILSLVSFPLTLLVAKIAAVFISDPRPFVVEHVKPLISHAADNGFPSDHTLLTMAIASVVFAYNRKLGIILFVIALLVGIARVFALIHHPLDIFGSTIIAIGTTYFSLYMLKIISSKGLLKWIKK